MFATSHLHLCRTIFVAAIGVSAFCQQAIAGDAAPVSGASQTRYVWAKNLVVRAEPDSKAAQVVKLPYGAEVSIETTDNPKSFQETWLKVHEDDKLPTTDVVLSGHWQKVHAAQGDGWAFDGYLSRYPAPTAKEIKSYSSDSTEDNGEALYAKRIFHVKAEYKWSGKDNKNSTAFRLMAKRQQLEKGAVPDEINWDYIEFTNGATYEYFSNLDGMSMSNEDEKKFPLSFNEAMLWAHVFGGDDAIGNNGKPGSPHTGKFEAGHHLEVGPADDETGVAHGIAIDCKGDTCDLNAGMAD